MEDSVKNALKFLLAQHLNPAQADIKAKSEALSKALDVVAPAPTPAPAK